MSLVGVAVAGVGGLLLLISLIWLARAVHGGGLSAAAKPILLLIAGLAMAGGGGFFALKDKSLFNLLPGGNSKEETAGAEEVNKDDLMALRIAVADLENEVNADGARLQKSFTELTQKRTKLDPKNAQAVQAYNTETAAYGQQKSLYDAKRTRLAEQKQLLQKKIEAAAAQNASQTASQTASTSPGGGKAPPIPQGVTLYYKKGWYPAVTMARTYLSGKRIVYREVDVESSDAAKKEWEQFGTEIPIIVAKGRVVHGYIRDELDQIFPGEQQEMP